MDFGTIAILAGLAALFIVAVVVLVRRDQHRQELSEYHGVDDPGPSHADAMGKAYAAGAARRNGGAVPF